MSTLDTVILGAGGHAKVLVDILNKNEDFCGAVVCPEDDLPSMFSSCYRIKTDEEVLKLSSEKIVLVNGIGGVPGNLTRRKLFLFFKGHGYSFRNVCSPDAVISDYVELKEGVQILPGAIVQAGAIIGANTIINSGAIVEHDCIIGEHCHIAPGVTLSGQVEVGNCVHIGTGASVIQSIVIGEGSVIGAGSIVSKNIDRFKTVYPARGIIK